MSARAEQAAGSYAAVGEADAEGLPSSALAAQQPQVWRRWLPLGLALFGAALAAVGLAAARRHAGAPPAVEALDATALVQLQEPELYQGRSKGLGTWYDPAKWGSGACGWNEEWKPEGTAGTVALNFADFNLGGKMHSCGMCIQVWAKGDYQWNGKAGGGSLPMHWKGDIFFVTNSCASCPGKGDIDFALQPGQGANPGQYGNGIWEIEWQGVPCPTQKNKSPTYMLDSGSNRHWVKVRPMNLHYPVVKMAFCEGPGEGCEYVEGRLGPQFGFQWNPSHGPAPLPLKVRMETCIGEVLYDEIPKLEKWVEGHRGVSDSGMR